jgi:hypothetical protein
MGVLLLLIRYQSVHIITGYTALLSGKLWRRYIFMGISFPLIKILIHVLSPINHSYTNTTDPL